MYQEQALYFCVLQISKGLLYGYIIYYKKEMEQKEQRIMWSFLKFSVTLLKKKTFAYLMTYKNSKELCLKMYLANRHVILSYSAKRSLPSVTTACHIISLQLYTLLGLAQFHKQKLKLQLFWFSQLTGSTSPPAPSPCTMFLW